MILIVTLKENLLFGYREKLGSAVKNIHYSTTEYFFQVPANRIGFDGNGGPFNLWQLKVLQEVISLAVFSFFTIIVFKNETFRLNHLIGFVFLILAVYFIFKK